jgi:hypothetical protein
MRVKESWEDFVVSLAMALVAALVNLGSLLWLS